MIKALVSRSVARDVEELMAQRGILLTSERVRQGGLMFGQMDANAVLDRRPRCGDTWPMDEMVLTIRGKTHSLWRAVNQDGNVLDMLLQSRHNTKAATRFFRQQLQELYYFPRVIITDTLKRYGAAKRETLTGVQHRLLSAFCLLSGYFQVRRHPLRAGDYPAT